MSQNYICSLFDGYADRFDHELVVTLDYRGHEQVVNAMINAMNINIKVSINSDIETPVLQGLSPSISDNKRLAVIDLGSGTGLCGALIRKLIPDINVYGVDLSQRMLEKAVDRRCYDSLILGDAEEYLLSCGLTVDAIIAADVFIYIGDLLKIMKASHSALKSKGFLIFTIEELINPLENISNLDLNTLDDDPSTLNEKETGKRERNKLMCLRLPIDIFHRYVSRYFQLLSLCSLFLFTLKP
jgi:predicted TPR repeat methyltransferase